MTDDGTLGADMATRGGTKPINSSATFDVTAGPRAVLRESVRLLHLVLGDERLGNAQANVRAAMRADEERARARDEVARLLKTGR